MASVIKTKTRLSSARSTQKVIKAMELVASSKIKKAREKAVGVEFYFNTTMDAMNNLYTYDKVQKLLNPGVDNENVLIFAITSDMGLCGGYNANVTKEIGKVIKEAKNYKNIVVGSKGINKLKFEGEDLLAEFHNNGHVTDHELALNITKVILDSNKSENYSNIKIIYTKFVNPLVQEVNVLDILKLDHLIDENKQLADLMVEPEDAKVFEQLFEQYVLSVVYSTLLNSNASEHAARRMSMEAANKNSLELIDNLNLELNRIRQSNITQEISEIIGGSEALKS